MSLYWNTKYRAHWFFNRVTKFEQASHVFVISKSGTFTICKILDEGKKIEKISTQELPERFNHLKNGVFKVSTFDFNFLVR